MAAVVVDGELLRDRVQDLAVGRQRHVPGGVQDQIDVGAGYASVATVDVGRAVTVRGAQIAAADTDKGPGNLGSRHRLGLLGSPPQRLDRRLDVHDVALQRAAVGRLANPHDLQAGRPRRARCARRSARRPSPSRHRWLPNACLFSAIVSSSPAKSGISILHSVGGAAAAGASVDSTIRSLNRRSTTSGSLCSLIAPSSSSNTEPFAVRSLSRTRTVAGRPLRSNR